MELLGKVVGQLVKDDSHAVGTENQGAFLLQNVYVTRVYPKVSGLAAWSENCNWYSCLPLSAVLSLFYDSV
jgi:hypothetical protein